MYMQFLREMNEQQSHQCTFKKDPCQYDNILSSADLLGREPPNDKTFGLASSPVRADNVSRTGAKGPAKVMEINVT